MSPIPIVSETDPTVGAQLPPSINPFEALQDQDNATALYNKEMAEFNSLAQQSAGLALLYFALVLCNTVLNYQGSEMEIESSLMDTISLLNDDLNHINSDITSIFKDLEDGDASKDPTQLSADVGQFVKDTAQYAVDLNCYFYEGGDLKSGQQVSPPFENDDFASAIASDFNIFQVTNKDGKSESLFQAFEDPSSVTEEGCDQFIN
ncbi:hypothetical protein [Simkania sp.]|uniref:hypothetical protein n=1 Tax=Simkania sp. TaxID=34094 RepID=UPI003B526777